MGSFLGSLIGAVLVAFVQVFGTYYFPDLALAFMYLIMLTGAGCAARRPARQGSVSRCAPCYPVAAAAIACWRWRPLGLPPYAMTLLTEALILGLFAMSLDLMVGYTRLHFVRPRRRLRVWRLCRRHTCCCTPACRCCSRFRSPASFSRHRRDRRRLGVHAGDRRVVLHADARLRATALRRRLQMDHASPAPPTGWPASRAAPARSASPVRDAQAASITSSLVVPARRLPVLPGAGALAVRRGAARHPRERGEDARARLQHPRATRSRSWRSSFALGGLAGALYAPFAGFANTELLFWLLSGQVLIMVIVGGAGTLVGPILGAAFFLLLSSTS